MAQNEGWASAVRLGAMVTVATSLLDRIADEEGAKVEIDAEGSLVVSPASDPHVIGASELFGQLRAAAPPGLLVLSEGPRWAPVRGEAPSYVPDIAVVARSSMRRSSQDYGLHPAPLLVVEVLSPDTRRRDLGDKADAYWGGGAGAYSTLELRGLMPVERPTLTVRRRGPSGWEVRPALTGRVEIEGPVAVHLDLHRLGL